MLDGPSFGSIEKRDGIGGAASSAVIADAHI
jgi:hypothetical protein